MPERSPQEIAAAQLNIDVEEAKRHVLDTLLDDSDASRMGFVDSLENLIGKTVVRWWFARIVKNSAAQERVKPEEVEERRRQRALKLIAACQIINAKAHKGAPPDALSLQMAIMDLTAAQGAIWRLLQDAAIIHPDIKQDYLDAGVDELYGRVTEYSSRIDLGRAPESQGPAKAN